MNRERPTCYMCDAPSVGKDHVPPKCLFPEEERYRKSLVKVPSCDKHNSGKSTDNQLLRWVLTMTNAHSETREAGVEKFGKITLPAPADCSEENKRALLRQLDEREDLLVSVMKDARRHRDFSAFTLVKMLRADNDKERNALRNG